MKVEEEMKQDRTQETQQEPGVKIVPVRNSLSTGTRLVARGNNGRFARQQKRRERELKVAMV